MDVGVPELLIILVLVILLFGVGRIGKIAGELGGGIRAFREGLQGQELPEKENKVAKVETADQVKTDVDVEEKDTAPVENIQ